MRPLTIGVAGAHSASGKTTIAAALLSRLACQPAACEVAALASAQALDRLPLQSCRRFGAIKYTESDLYASIVEECETPAEEGKDTARLFTAGAATVLWVQSPRDELPEVMPTALARLAHLDAVVIEGNSAIAIAEPDIVIFIFGLSFADVKPSGPSIIRRADIILIPSPAPFDPSLGKALREEYSLSTAVHPPVLLCCGQIIGGLGDNETEELIRHMVDIDTRKRIEERLLQASLDGKIFCGVARSIAEELGVPYREVGSAANDLKIKVKDCELGCF